MPLQAVILFLSIVPMNFAVRDGLDIFFQTNLKEMIGVPIFFDKPLPVWLKGTLVRNGFGRFEIGSRSMRNAVDAFAKVASWSFPGDGSAYFSTRMVYTDSYLQSLKTNTIAPYETFGGTIPPFSFLEDLEALRNGMDNTNVNVYKIRDNNSGLETLMLVSDIWKVYSMTPHNLTTIQGVEFPLKQNNGVALSTSHPLPEFGTTNLLTFVSIPGFPSSKKGLIRLMRIKSLQERETIAEVEVDKVPYMHSFGVTENYAVLIGTACYISFIEIMHAFTAEDSMVWNSDEVTRIYVIHLKTGKVTTLKTENMFFLHIVNSFETDDNEIIMDICTYQDPSALKTLDLTTLASKTLRSKVAKPYLKRYTIDLRTNAVKVKVFASVSGNLYINKFDFPVINEHYRYANYCYIYGIVNGYEDDDFLKMALVKKDVCTGVRERVYSDSNVYMNEAIFVPHPKRQSEDDGVLLMHVVDPIKRQTNMTILDAKTLKPISNALLPTNIPFTTHAHFFDNIW